jgi:hypothetical protein
LPDPDSPTIPTISDSSTEKEKLFTSFLSIDEIDKLLTVSKFNLFASTETITQYLPWAEWNRDIFPTR